MRTLVIINPHCGGLDNLSETAATIRRHPSLSNPDIRITGGRGDASLLAREGKNHGFRRILAVGGDGTFHEVVNGVMPDPGELTVGLLPLGTGNDFARTLDLPLDLEGAMEALPTCRPCSTDLVRVHREGEDERYFVNASAGGFSGEVDQENTEERKEVWGPLSYLRSALDVLPDPPRYVTTLEVDGEAWDARELLNVVVANGRTVAGGIPMAPEADPRDGLLELVVVRSAPLRDLAGFGSMCLVGRHLDHELVEHVRARRVSVRSRPAMPFNLDGELMGTTPVGFEICPGALSILTPS